MKYENKSITSDGEKLLAQSVANKQAPVIDKMLVLNTDIPLEKTIDSLTLNDFSNAISFDVNNVSQNDNSFTASAVISNNEINQDYSAKLIGISGYLSNSDNRKLFAVAQASEPFVITRQAETPLTLVPSITIGFSNSQNVQLTVKNDVYVTQSDLDKMGFAKKEDLNNLNETINQNINGPNSTVSQNIENMGTKANQYTDDAKKDLQNKINVLFDNTLINRGQIPDTNLDNIKKTGIYILPNYAFIQTTNAPNKSSGYQFLIVYSINNDLVKQEIIDDHKIRFERFGVEDNSWGEWQQFASIDEVIQRDKQIEQNAKQYTDEQNKKQIKFFNSLDEVNNSSAPEGTIAIVKG
ncbi:hypothetical protein DY124_06080 [Apilactobacillus micheneri]|uniref:pyocin knob domain-containing protein n=1 Tax=Apilactobacillus micheneri TaxID=1899430 RepID=UPI00112A0A2C|nr:pyocin knob domain-containing protein [Apilactobacillus micheneri]TPR43142.1 hypothetical protein DY124_06080 [Apilactobacillus micheneri]TPR47230.1 hypothetical protein DY125_06575 [Apilactobacillus micheneri]